MVFRDAYRCAASGLAILWLRARKVGEIIREFVGDSAYYIRYNGYSPLVDRNARLFYKLIIEAHAIEKGLSTPDPRPLFGKSKIKWILDNIDGYEASLSKFPLEMVDGVLSDYHDRYAPQYSGSETIDSIEKRIVDRELQSDYLRGGVRYSERPQENMAARSFLRSRSSLRMFSSEKLPMQILRDSIVTAQSAPSQCNRQATKVHFYQEKEKIVHLLKLQGGANGFSENVGNLLIVSNEISAWGGAQQRNQLYVDGALFAMMLLLALHANGLATCPLNLAVCARLESEIRSVGDIPMNERLVMMIAVGWASSGPLRVAKSPRRVLEEVLSVHL